MPHTTRHDRSPRRRLRREMPGTVAVLADEGDFAAMRAYPSFAFDDHPDYLRQVESLLRSLAGRGLHTRLAVFDPTRFAVFCAEEDLEPDSAGSRTRYTAEVAATGAAVTYDGRPLRELLPQLLDGHARARTWELFLEELSLAGTCERCGRDIGQATFERAVQAVDRLLRAIGSAAEERTLVCSVRAPGRPLAASVVLAPGDGPQENETAPGLVLLCGVLAVSFATGCPGGLVLRTRPAEPSPEGVSARPEQVRGWRTRDGWLQPLTAAEVFDAYCTHAGTGEPVPPEPGVDHLPGLPLSHPGGRPHCDRPAGAGDRPGPGASLPGEHRARRTPRLVGLVRGACGSGRTLALCQRVTSPAWHAHRGGQTDPSTGSSRPGR